MATQYGEMYALAMFHSPEVKSQITVTEAPRIGTRSCRWHSLDGVAVKASAAYHLQDDTTCSHKFAIIAIDCI